MVWAPTLDELQQVLARLSRKLDSPDRLDWWQSKNETRLAPHPAASLAISARHIDEKLDLAALQVSRSLETNKNIIFFELDSVCRLPMQFPSSVAVIGFPSDAAQRIASNAYALCASGFWTGKIKRGTKRPSDFNPRTHFLIGFPPAKDGRRPHGFSGAGAWFSDSRDKIWTPSPRLAGICTNYYPERQLLSICRIEKVIAFLQQAFSEN